MGMVAARAVAPEGLEAEEPKGGRKIDQGFLDRVRQEMQAYLDETGRSQAEVAKARAYLMAALNREGGLESGPWRNYWSATFTERCGLIALMRGKGGFLVAPEGK